MEKPKEWWETFPESETTSEFYRLKVGDNKVRVLTQFEKVNQLFEGEYPNGKYIGIVDDEYKPKESETINLQGWAWAIDRETGDLVILQVGKGILKLIASLRADAEYSFEDFPMPYDINIKNTGEGPNRYSIVASRQNTPVSETELAKLEKKTSISEIIKRIREKREGKALERVSPTETVEYPEENINVDDIPF